MPFSLSSELRHAVRGLRRAPTLTLAALLCLGLGIGATTAIYSAVHTALLRALPFADPDGLVSVFRTTPQFSSGPFAPANYLDLRDGTQSLEALAAVGTGVALMEGAEEPLRVSVNQSSGDLFAILGVQALQGRLLQTDDEGPEQPQVAVITEEMWRGRFGADPGMVGRTITLGGEAHEVVGVLPGGFKVPHGSRTLRADVWVPLRFTPEQASWRRSNFLLTVGRLRPGTQVEAADAELQGVMSGIVEAHPELRGEQVRVVPLHRESVRAVRGPLLLLLGSVGLVLLIAAANVASILLARGVARREEFAVRTVLGAKRRDIVRPALVESVLLAAVGSILGVGLAWAGVRLIRTLVPERLPQLAELSIDVPVLGFSLLLAAVVATICAVAPALQATSGDPQDALRAGGRGGTGGRHQRWLRGLVVSEVALSLILLLGAALVIRGFQRLVNQDPGFDPEPLLTLYVNVSPERHGEAGTVDGFLMPALEAVRAVPGVLEAGGISLIPYDNWGWNFNIRYEGRPVDDPTRLPLVENRVVTPGMFATLEQNLLRGRLLTDADEGDGRTPVVVVANEALAERDFPGEDPVGKRFHLSDTTFATIVGVVSDIKNFGPDRAPRPEVYWSYAQRGFGETTFPMMVRVSGDPSGFARPVTDAIRSVDPSAAVSLVRPMEEVMSRSVARPRFYLALMAIFAGVALALALAGLYGVMSYAVAQRTRELGIRAALGSTPAQIVAVVMGQGMALLVLGSVVGLLGSFGLTRLLSSLLYGVSPLDALTWTLVPLLLASSAAAATFVPAHRASGIEPTVAIREE